MLKIKEWSWIKVLKFICFLLAWGSSELTKTISMLLNLIHIWVLTLASIRLVCNALYLVVPFSFSMKLPDLVNFLFPVDNISHYWCPTLDLKLLPQWSGQPPQQCCGVFNLSDCFFCQLLSVDLLYTLVYRVSMLIFLHHLMLLSTRCGSIASSALCILVFRTDGFKSDCMNIKHWNPCGKTSSNEGVSSKSRSRKAISSISDKPPMSGSINLDSSACTLDFHQLHKCKWRS